MDYSPWVVRKPKCLRLQLGGLANERTSTGTNLLDRDIAKLGAHA
jgi:hypothetical protein